jgi:hypothetical protein
VTFDDILYDEQDGIAGTEEAMEGRNAVLEKRKPNFRKCRRPQ